MGILSLGSAREMARNVNQATCFRHAMERFYDRYGHYPSGCTNITELALVLDGHNINDNNLDQVRFFAKKIPLKKRVLDGFGNPFVLIRAADGTNLLIRSFGKKGVDTGGIKGTYTYNISMRCCKIKTDITGKSLKAIRNHPFSTSTLQHKETNNVDSVRR
jgi:hypothetical protein